MVCIFSSLLVIPPSTQNIQGIFHSELTEEFKIYENPLYGINIKYPGDWRYYEKNGPENFSPDRIFQVSFLSPPNKVLSDMVFVWFNVEKIKDSLSLDDRKNILLKNLNNSSIDVKVQSTKLSGINAFMIDYKNEAVELQRHIGIETIRNGLLYSLDFTAQPDTFEKNLDSIETMINSTKISTIA
ncbi:MAG TPA: PsbP-related protein [Nitrososphaeraceae archaeon]|nr:PsbP-related protein [Nitrososphaeraceae archaeon]